MIDLASSEADSFYLVEKENARSDSHAGNRSETSKSASSRYVLIEMLEFLVEGDVLAYLFVERNKLLFFKKTVIPLNDNSQTRHSKNFNLKMNPFESASTHYPIIPPLSKNNSPSYNHKNVHETKHWYPSFKVLN